MCPTKRSMRPRDAKQRSNPQERDPLVIDLFESTKSAEVERALEIAAFLKRIGDTEPRTDELMQRLVDSYYPNDSPAAETIGPLHTVDEGPLSDTPFEPYEEEMWRDEFERKAIS